MQLNDVNDEYHYINNSYDKIFRKALDNKCNAVEIINRFLKPKNKILKEDIVKFSSSFVSDDLKNLEADIVYKIKNKEIFFLIEHQTKIDYSMPYRILKYEVEIIESAIDKKKYKNKNYKYPIVIPIVLYTGNKKWNAKLDLRKSQLKWDEYEAIELSKYNILDINTIDTKELLKEKDIISKLIIIEKSTTKDEFNENLIKISKVLNENKNNYTKEEIQFLSKAIKTIIYAKLGSNEANEVLKNFNLWKENDTMQVVEMLDREYNKMRKIGKKEGIKKGIKEAKLQVVENMIKYNFSIKMISTISGLKEEEIKRIIKK